MLDRVKDLVPEGIRSRLSPWRHQPVRQFRLEYYERFFRGGVIRRWGLAYRIYGNDEIGRLLYLGIDPVGDEVEVLKRCGRHFASFIDVGANIGTVCIPIAKSFPGPILAVEPVQRNFDVLCENLRLNDVTQRVSARRVAIGSSAGTTNMYLSVDNCGDHRAGRPLLADKRQVEVVDVETLAESVLADRRLRPPFLVKVDVQGFEAEVIAGAAPLLLSNACLILLEFWPEGLRANGCMPTDLFRLLDGNGLRIWEMMRPLGLRRIERADELEKLAPNLPGDHFCNLVATNRELAEMELEEFVRQT